MRYFYSSFIITIFGLFCAYFLGGASAVYICFLLCILEVSLSFDNAVVNAKVLEQMSELWQRRFIVWGIPVAVFGMRFFFPLLIVAIAAKIGIFETFFLAFQNPDRYHEILSEAKEEIYIFGGGFLLMVFFNFFFDRERNVFWLGFLENNALVRNLSRIRGISVLIAAIFGGILYAKTANLTYLAIYFSAIFAFVAVSSFDKFFSKGAVKNGVAGFLYLEMLDASFSFDGVIGAFALSENIFIIMIGLGSGAMFVRSMTIYLVKKGTLTELIYLEHGAHYAILALAVIMFLKIFYEVGEILTGTISFALIALSLFASLKYRKSSLKNLQGD
ncbi:MULTISPECIES: DUF475 domain-containing protein [unclassified Campylobacter]|uniref:DUF475 domain-containing protein n=1 Tax=unclassified Campylobacter TaxID=2593542 RepID=UPI0022EA0842|nr:MULTISPECIES: DUF475 domain-containing protein [unclassified Campylobacter]MDA3080164.1 DUF475 domain-containing protein [Campylobacter sp. CS_NA2]MDA3081615.1 DUF475 domain-containing protein [Campylobacter sp. CS_NA1]MDA3086221.1 DUF475 domain-containing protein [Campylobacter sp. CS_ED1]MDA3090830.1 DUF475 domain-containing protein [Campylobacter sp. CS_ED2]WBR51103.1 DUF475 domain-containing protein [Campylobacter sp. CS_NA3]